MSIRFYHAISLTALLFLTVVVPSNAAAEEEPLRLVYLNLGGAEAEASQESVESMLRDSDQIEVIASDILLNAATNLGLQPQSFSADRRRDHEDEIAHLMWNTHVEGLLVHDIDDEVTSMSVATVGPQGRELSAVSHPLTDGDLDRQETRTVLEDVFQSLVPEVREFRRDVEAGELTDEDFELDDTERADATEEVAATDAAGEPDEPPAGDLREEAARQHRRQFYLVERTLALRAGALTGHRSMEMAQPAGSFSLGHSTTLMGVGLRVDSVVASFDDGDAGIGVGGVVGWSPISTLFEGEEFGGSFMQLAVEGRYIHRIGDATRLRAIGGIETMNLSIDPNEHYTGHGYFTARIGGGFAQALDDLAVIRLDALLMPIIAASNSGGAEGPYGDAGGWLGAGADLGVDVEIFSPILLSANYGFRYLDLDYPEPTGIDGPATSTDFLHQVMITAGYRL